MKDTNATVLVDLSKLEFDKDVWWGIRKAVKNNLVVKVSDDYYRAYLILNETLERGGAKPANYDNLKKDTVLFICYKGLEIIGMASVRMRNDIPMLNWLASKSEYNSLCTNYLLVWHCILWANENGYHQFDMGGWQINAAGHLKAVNKFKEQFGKVHYWEEEYPFLKALKRKIGRYLKGRIMK